MATLRDIINRSWRRLNAFDAREDPSDADASDILAALNEMMTGMKADGVDVLWGADKTLATTFPLDDKHREGVIAILATKIAGMFQVPIPQDVADDAVRGQARLFADYSLPDPMKVDLALRNMPSLRRTLR